MSLFRVSELSAVQAALPNDEDMLSEEQLGRYARVVYWGLEVSLGRKLAKNDPVLIRYDRGALELAERLYALLVERRMHVLQRMEPTAGMQRALYKNGSARQLLYEAPGEHELFGVLAGCVRILCPESMNNLADISPEIFGLRTRALKSVRALRDKRQSLGQFGWTVCAYPGVELAGISGMEPGEYARRVAAACRLNSPEPVREWNRVRKELAEIAAWLNDLDAKGFTVESDSTDLFVPSGESRRWLGVTGRNLPGYELYFSPDWRGVRGTYFADLPSVRREGVVRGVRLVFDKGNVVRADADQGAAFMFDALSTDPGANRLGEFSLTDVRFSPIDRFMGMTLFDENFGGEHGNCHIALGSSYHESYVGSHSELTVQEAEALGFNASSLHWDLVNTRPKRVKAQLRDGSSRTVYENGVFAC